MAESYEDRYVVFLDVMGWNQLVALSVTDPTVRSKLASATQDICDLLTTMRERGEFLGDRYTQFSDSLVFSLKTGDPRNHYIVIKFAAYFCQKLAEYGLFVRGAVCRGLLAHSDCGAYGPALNEAVAMESQIAIYPRVCVGSLVVEESERSGMCFPPFNAVNVIKVDRDGICFVDWLSLAAQNDKAWTLDPFVENFMFRVKAAIRNELAQWRGQPRILQKYLWLVSHWNEVAAQHPTKLSPIGPLGDGAPYRDAEPAR